MNAWQRDFLSSHRVGHLSTASADERYPQYRMMELVEGANPIVRIGFGRVTSWSFAERVTSLPEPER